MPLFYSLEIHVFLKGLTHWAFIYLVQLMSSKHILPYSVMVSPALLSIRQNWWYYHLSFTFSRLQTAIWCCGMAKENPFLHKNGFFFLMVLQWLPHRVEQHLEKCSPLSDGSLWFAAASQKASPISVALSWFHLVGFLVQFFGYTQQQFHP